MGGVGSGRRKNAGGFSVTDKDRGYQKMKKEFKNLGGNLKVGIQGWDALKSKKDSDGEAISGLTVVDVGTFHEFGAEGIPQRSFLGDTVDLNRQTYDQIISRLIYNIMLGKMNAKNGLELFGLRVVKDVQKRIADGIDPENADSTIAAKGSSKPLVDTGQLRQSITFVVEGAKK